MKFTIEIVEPSQLAGITAARLFRNSQLAQTVINESGQEIANPELIESDDAYIQFVMLGAAASYAEQYKT